MPTTPLLLAGQTMLPSVSVPIETAVKFAAAAAPDPELDPQGLRSMAYGLLHCPPRPDQPLVEKNERKLAHSLRVVLPRMTAPAARSLAATVASCAVAAATAASGEVASGASDAVAPASAPSLSTSRRLKPVDVSCDMNSLLVQ